MGAADAGAAGSKPATPAGPPKRADARRNYDRLLAAAADAYAERGSDDVSLEEIARRAGVGIGTLYRNFPVRQALLEAVYTGQVAALDALGARLAAEQPPGAALAGWLRAFFGFAKTKQILTAAIVSEAGPEAAVCAGSRSILWGRAEELLRRAQDAGEARPDVQVSDILRLTHGLIMAPGPGPADAGQDERLFSLVIGGLLAGAAAR